MDWQIPEDHNNYNKHKSTPRKEGEIAMTACTYTKTMSRISPSKLASNYNK